MAHKKVRATPSWSSQMGNCHIKARWLINYTFWLFVGSARFFKIVKLIKKTG